MKKLVFLFIVAMLSFVIIACGEAEVKKVDANNELEETENNKNANGSNDNENSVNTNESNETENNVNMNESDDNEEADEDLAVGDTVNFDGLEITLNEARVEEGGEFDEPTENQFVVANLTINNTTDEEQIISSIMNIELKDDEGYAYNTTFLMDGTKGQLDGDIEPGGTLRGEIPFDVTESETYELHFSDPFKSGKAIWTITSDQLN